MTPVHGPINGLIAFRVAAVVTAMLMCRLTRAEDWPTWRHDANRSGAAPESLPEQLHLQWIRELPTPEPAWPDEPKLDFDRTVEPVVMGRTMFVPSTVNDSVTALDTRTGQVKWRFFTGGPVRFAPAAWNHKVYFVSDDGSLYCLDAKNGKLLWEFRGAPSAGKILGNGRLISTWPARGGPVLAGGKVYFAAGIWPFMGVFLYALDAENGQIDWTNDSSGALLIDQPHGPGRSFSGLAPQGYLVVSEDRLLVPNGRSYPVLFDRISGELREIHLGFRDEANCRVAATRKYFFAGISGMLNDDGSWRLSPHRFHEDGFRLPVLTDRVVYRNVRVGKSADAVIQAGDLTNVQWGTVRRWGGEQARMKVAPLWTSSVTGRVRIKAGSRLYATEGNRIIALELPRRNEDRKTRAPHHAGTPPRPENDGVRRSRGTDSRISWQTDVEGTPWTLLAADERLFAVTLEGTVYCFGGEKGEPRMHRLARQRLSSPPRATAQQAMEIVKRRGAREGYCLVLGLGEGGLVEQLLRESELPIVGIDSDLEKVNTLRRKLDEAGLYGRRVSLHVGDLLTIRLPSYLASLIVSDDLDAAGMGAEDRFVTSLHRVLRPYGGVACLRTSESEHDKFAQWVRQRRLPQAKLTRVGDLTMLRRVGPLPGAADWTHERADAANSLVSADHRVKAPLGLLWFGGQLRNDMIIDKRLSPPTPRVVEGRMFVQALDAIRAVDVYTGRIAWRHAFTDRQGDHVTLLPPERDSRVLFDSKPASEDRRDVGKVRRIGYNVACANDGLYIAYGKKCLRLDPATGKIIDELTLPSTEAGRPPPYWVDLRIWEDMLVATAVSSKIPTDAQGLPPKELNSYRKAFLDNLRIGALEVVPANLLVGLDRHSGKVLWQREAAHGFLGPKFVWHAWGTFNAANDCLAVGNGKVFCLDGMDPDVHQAMVRRGHAVRAGNALLAIDARTGSVIWRSPVERYCTLSYSSEHDVLVEVTPDMGTDYPHASGFTAKGMSVRQGSSGQVLWEKSVPFRGPCILYHDTLIAQTGEALDLLTGKTRMRNHPLTGEPISWGSIDRTYGCNYAVGSEHLLTFRSSTAGYSDIRHNVTGTFGGFRTGCTNSLIPAGGLLNLPNLANSCYCNYQNQTSLALVHMPEAETWTWTRPPHATRAIRRVGLNFGAPGDRLAASGTLWLDYPSVGGPSPDLPVRVTPEGPRWYYHHASRIQRGPLPWVVSSGVEGVESITLTTAVTGDSDSRSAEESAGETVTIRLYFAELSGRRPGDRVFDVSLQGRVVLKNFDILQAVGRANVGIVREFTGIRIADALTIGLEPKKGEPLISGIELVVED